MLEYFRRKASAFREAIAADVVRAAEDGRRELAARLDGVEEQLRVAQRRERRGQLALESILEAQAAVQKSLGRLEMTTPRLQGILAFAESFILAERAAPATPESGILRSKFEAMLEQCDLAPIAEPFVAFDPERHEACGATENPDLPEGVVAQVVRPGFVLAGPVVRPAVVVVNRRETAPEEEQACSSRP